MHCPACKTVALAMADRQGIEIDYCPQCRGVWLDRGELDKIIERSAEVPALQEAPGRYDERARGEDDRRPRYGHEDRSRGYGDDRYGKRKRRGFLSDIFDFD